MRKARTLRISTNLLCDFLHGPVPPGITQQGFPSDAKIVDSRMVGSSIELLIESDTFDPVPTLGPFPMMEVTFTRQYQA